MRLPSPDAYRSAIQHPSVAFPGNSELAKTTPKANPYGIPVTYSGNFTATFHLEGDAGQWAIRCYTREIKLVTERYDAISRFLDGRPDPVNSPWRDSSQVEFWSQATATISSRWSGSPALTSTIMSLRSLEVT